jgi:hypothetical protein
MSLTKALQFRDRFNINKTPNFYPIKRNDGLEVISDTIGFRLLHQEAFKSEIYIDGFIRLDKARLCVRAFVSDETHLIAINITQFEFESLTEEEFERYLEILHSNFQDLIAMQIDFLQYFKSNIRDLTHSKYIDSYVSEHIKEISINPSIPHLLINMKLNGFWIPKSMIFSMIEFLLKSSRTIKLKE